MKRFIFFITIVISFCFLTSSAQAINLNVKEGKVRLSIPPGSSKAGAINLNNVSAEPIEIKAYLEDWYYLPGADGSKEFKPAGTTPLSCAQWISFTPAEFTIPAYGSRKINYTVQVPLDAKGGHYAVLFFETRVVLPSLEEGIGVGVAARIGSLFYIEPEGTIVRQVNIESFSLTRESKSSPLAIKIGIKNNGNVDLTTTGTFHIIDRQGRVYARSELNEAYTFANDSAQLEGTWKEPISAGEYDLVVTLDLGKALEEAGMGRGPTLVKEADLEIGPNGGIVSVSALR
jgi:hypothetical protein